MVLGLFRLGLIQRGLKRTRVDLGDEVARLNRLAFVEGDLLDLPVDARAHRHGVVGLHLPEAVDVDGVIRALGRGDGDESGLGFGVGRRLRRRSSIRAARQRIMDPVRDPPCGRDPFFDIVRSISAIAERGRDDQRQSAGESSKSHCAIHPLGAMPPGEPGNLRGEKGRERHTARVSRRRAFAATWRTIAII